MCALAANTHWPAPGSMSRCEPGVQPLDNLPLQTQSAHTGGGSSLQYPTLRRVVKMRSRGSDVIAYDARPTEIESPDRASVITRSASEALGCPQ